MIGAVPNTRFWPTLDAQSTTQIQGLMLLAAPRSAGRSTAWGAVTGWSRKARSSSSPRFSGSGAAYYPLFSEALAQAGARIVALLTQNLASQTALGAAREQTQEDANNVDMGTPVTLAQDMTATMAPSNRTGHSGT